MRTGSESHGGGVRGGVCGGTVSARATAGGGVVQRGGGLELRNGTRMFSAGGAWRPGWNGVVRAEAGGRRRRVPRRRKVLLWLWRVSSSCLCKIAWVREKWVDMNQRCGEKRETNSNAPKRKQNRVDAVARQWILGRL